MAWPYVPLQITVTFSVIFTVLCCPSGEAQILLGRVLLDNVNTVQGSMLADQDQE